MVRFSSCLCFCSFSGAVLDSEFPVQPLCPTDQSLDPGVYSTDDSGAPHTAVQCRDVENVGKREKKRELSFLI